MNGFTVTFEPEIGMQFGVPARRERSDTMEKQYAHEFKTELEDGSTIFRTCAWSPPGCHPTSCGVEITVKDGRIVHVEGDESQPITNGRLCPRCLALKDYNYHEDRIMHPMKRAKEYRGQSDKWEQIT